MLTTQQRSTKDRDTVTMLVIGRLRDLEQRINSKTLGRIRELQVESTGDSILLHGTTTTYYSKQLATQIILEEFGDYTLDNEIQVV